MAHTFTSLRALFSPLAFAALIGTAPRAHAGDVSSVRIAAATPDGNHAAVFNLTNDYPNGTCALIPLDGTPKYDDLLKPLASATCPAKGEKVTPYSRWNWEKRLPKHAELVVFADAYDDKSEGQRARIVVDRDTRLARLEVLQKDRWWPVKAMPGGVPKLTGTALLPGGGLLVRTSHRFRFSDVALVDYFSLFSFYNPVSTKTWQKLTVDKFFLKDPDKSALSYRTPTLQAILEVEKERGLEKPSL